MAEPKFLSIRCNDGKNWAVEHPLPNKYHCYVELDRFKNQPDFWHKGFEWFFMDGETQIRMAITNTRSGKVAKYDPKEHIKMATSYQ